MEKQSVRSMAVLLLCLCLLAGVLTGCGNTDKAEEPAAQETGASLSADDAYQAAISAEEGEECTSEECVVTLYDDTEDIDYPYNVLSPLGAVSASKPAP